jgi:hypothetical protein
MISTKAKKAYIYFKDKIECDIKELKPNLRSITENLKISNSPFARISISKLI